MKKYFRLIFCLSIILLHFTYLKAGQSNFVQLNGKNEKIIEIGKDTIVILNNQSGFIYSTNGGIDWNYKNNNKLEIITEIYQVNNTNYFLNTKGEVYFNTNLLGNLLTKLNTFDYVIQTIIQHNYNIYFLTKKGELLLLNVNDLNNISLVYSFEYKFNNPKYLKINNEFVIYDKIKIYKTTNFRDWVEIKSSFCNFCLTNLIKYNENNLIYVYSTSKIFILDINFKLIKEIDFSNYFLNISNNSDIIYLKSKKNNYFEFYQTNGLDTIKLNYKFKNNDSLAYLKYNFIINDVYENNKYIYFVGNNSLILKFNKEINELEFISFCPNEFKPSFLNKNTLKFIDDKNGGFIDSKNNLFITKNSGITWQTFYNQLITNILSNPSFYINKENVLYIRQSGKNKNILIKNDESEKYLNFGYFSSNNFDLIYNSSFYSVQFSQWGSNYNTIISKFDLINNNLYFDSTFGNRNNALSLFDSLKVESIYIFNKDKIFINAFSSKVNTLFNYNFYEITNSGKNIRLLGDSSQSYLQPFFIDEKNFLCRKIRESNGNFYSDIYKTTNSGEGWNLVYKVENEDNGTHLNAKFIKYKNEIWMFEIGYELISTDNGESWTKVVNFPDEMISNGFAVDSSMYLIFEGVGANKLVKYLEPDFISSINEESTEDFEIPTFLFTNTYPNPARDEVNVAFHYDQRYNLESAVAAVFDIYGKEIIGLEPIFSSKSNYQAEIKLNTQLIPSGIYILNLNFGNTSKAVKFNVIK